MTLRGWDEVTLESEHLRMVVLPEKGADIVELTDRRLGVDALLRVDGGPRPNDGTLHDDVGGYPDWFRGGWQVILPNGDLACLHGGVEHEHAGELWRRPFRVEARDAGSVRLATELETVPLAVRKTLRLNPARPAFELVETVENRSEEPLPVVWGQHPVFGSPLLAPGARLEIGPCRAQIDHLDSTTRLVPGPSYTWPHAPLRGGGVADLSVVGGPELGWHELALLHDLSDGRFALVNEELGLGFELRFDHSTFPWLWVWLCFGGGDEAPWQGLYAIAVEPMTGTRSLADSFARGTALTLAPGERRTARFEGELFDPGECAAA